MSKIDLYVLVVYSFDKEYRKEIGKPSSSYKKLEKAQDGLDDRLDSDKFYSVIEPKKAKEKELFDEKIDLCEGGCL